MFVNSMTASVFRNFEAFENAFLAFAAWPSDRRTRPNMSKEKESLWSASEVLIEFRAEEICPLIKYSMVKFNHAV